jgi:hypothetical protein
MATKKAGKSTKRLNKSKKLEATRPLAQQPYLTVKGTKQG